MVVIAITAFLIGKGMRDDKYTEVLPEDSAAFVQWQRGGERRDYSRTHNYYNVEGKKAERFYFDPNTATALSALSVYR